MPLFDPRNLETLTFVWGPPGTGKTHYLTEQVARLIAAGHNPLVCSLTRTAAAELASRDNALPPENIGTLHAHAYRTLGRPAQVAESMIASWNEQNPEYKLDPALTKATVDDVHPPDDMTSTQTQGGRLYQLYNALRMRMVPRTEWGGDIKHFAERWEAWKRDNDLMDFTDMLEWCIEGNVHAPGWPTAIVVDEAQDHGRLELELLWQWAQQAGTLILAGDPYQSLYEWRGATPRLLQSIKPPHRRVLAQSYRVPKRVRDFALAWLQRTLSNYEAIDYRPRDGDDGFITCAPRCNLASWDAVIELIEEKARTDETVMIAATCGYMLNGLICRMRELGIPFSNPWRTHRGDWNPLAPRRGSLAEALKVFLSARPHMRSYWTHENLARALKPLKTSSILRRGQGKRLEDKATNEFLADLPLDEKTLLDAFKPAMWRELIALFRRFHHGERGPLLMWWRERLKNAHTRHGAYLAAIVERYGPGQLSRPPSIYVGTVHSFKGAEASHVIVAPDLSLAGLNSWRGARALRDQVVRTFYVAFTRARKTLTVLAPMNRDRAVDVDAVF